MGRPSTFRAQAVSFYTACRVGESSVIGQHRPTLQPGAPRRATASTTSMLGRGPEKGRQKRCVDTRPRPREGPPPALRRCLAEAPRRAAPASCSCLLGALKRAEQTLMLVSAEPRKGPPSDQCKCCWGPSADLWDVPTSPPRGEGWSYVKPRWQADASAGTDGHRSWRALCTRLWCGL